jgi:hypothetical protein
MPSHLDNRERETAGTGVTGQVRAVQAIVRGRLNGRLGMPEMLARGHLGVE